MDPFYLMTVFFSYDNPKTPFTPPHFTADQMSEENGVLLRILQFIADQKNIHYEVN